MNRKTTAITLALALSTVGVCLLLMGLGGRLPAVRAQGTLLLEENFEYGSTPGNLTTVSGGTWVAHSGAGSGPVQYVTSTLSMFRYGSSDRGGAATISTTGSEDVNRSFANQTSGTVYFAALVRVTAAGTGDYFLHLKDATTNFRARVFARDSSGALQFGLGTTGAATWSSTNFAYDTTYLLVARYNVTTGDTALYVLTAPVPAEPAIPLISLAGAGTQAVQAIAIRQGTAGQRPAAIIDGIRVADTWEEAIGYTGDVSATKSVTPTTGVTRHGTVTYTVVLRNSMATSDTVYLTDTLPAEVDFQGWLVQPAGATVTNDEITWNGTLSASTALTFSFTAVHVGDYGDVVTNTAQFSGTYDTGTAQATFTVERLTRDVTFIYHDLEDVVRTGESVYLAGDFNSWSPTATLMTADAGLTVFSVTVPGLNVGQGYGYKYVVSATATSQWDWLNTNNRTITVTSGMDTVDDYRNVVVGWANLQWPYTLQTNVNDGTDPVYGRVYIQNVTNPAGEGRSIHAQVGYGNSSNPAAWTWFPMTYNVDNGNNDEFMGVMTPTVGGIFSYTTRFDGNWGTGNPNAGWTYGDMDGAPPFDLGQTGVLTSVLYDVAVSKTALVNGVLVRDGEGALVTYTLAIENRSTLTSTSNITLTDVLPTGFEYASDDSGVTPTGSGSAGDPLTWVFAGPLQPGETLSFTLVLSATDALTASGRYTDTAAIRIAGGDWVAANDTAAAGVMVYRVVPIATARAGNIGQIFAVEGRVIYVPGTYNANEWGLQDDSGGIAAFYSPPPAVTYGDRVLLVATRKAFNNQEELESPVYYFANQGSGPEVNPIPHATGDIPAGTTEGWLVQLEGYVSGLGSCSGNYTFYVNDGSGAAYIYVDLDTGINVCSMGVTNGDYVRVAGFSTQYQATYEVKPRRPADVQELYPVTFVYHDLEDVVHVGEDVQLRGDFNGWNALAMAHDANYTVFTATVIMTSTGTYAYKYYVPAVGDPGGWDLLNTANRSVNVTASGQRVDDYRNVIVGWAILQWPPSIAINLGQSTGNIYGRLYISNVTNPTGEGRGIHAQVGYGASADPAAWSWFPMTYNTDDWNNDEFQGAFTPTASGVFSYAVRFDGNWGAGNPNAGWTYADLDGYDPFGSGDPFELSQCGVLTVRVPDLSASSKTVTPTGQVLPGSLLTYTISLVNAGGTAVTTATVHLTDTLPAEVVVLTATLPAGMTYDDGTHTLHWTGQVAPGATVDLTFEVQVLALEDLAPGLHTFHNTVIIADGYGGLLTRQSPETTVQVYANYLPLVTRRYP